MSWDPSALHRAALALALVCTALVVATASHAQVAESAPAEEAGAAGAGPEEVSQGTESEAEPDPGWSFDEVEALDSAGGGEQPVEDIELAPSEPSRDDRIEEITVRGTKRQGNLQETPMAVSVFDMQQLDTANIQGFDDLSFSIPNFNYAEVLGAASFTIRGIGTLGGESATALHIDGIYQQNPYTASGIAFYDLAGVEVLRGPTGTQYGRNANAGALNVLTNPPSFDFEAFGDIQAGSYHEIRIRGVVNVPVVDDKLAVRMSGIVNRRYGYTKNLASDVRSGDLDDDRSMGIRGQVRFQPTPDIDWVTRATYVRDRSNGLSLKIDGAYPDPVPLLDGLPDFFIYTNAPQPNPSSPREIYLDTPTDNGRNFIMANSTFAWSMEEVPVIGRSQLTVFGGYQYSDQYGAGDVDFSNSPSYGLPTGPAPGPYPMIALDIVGDSSEWVAEASFEAVTPLEPDWVDLEWLVGVFYFGRESDVRTDMDTAFELRFTDDPLTPGALMIGETWSDPTSRDHSAAVLGNASFTLWDDVTLIGGFRYSWDWVESAIQTSGLVTNFPDDQIPDGICIALPIDDEGSARFDALIGRVSAEWQVTDENMVYASFSSGYKPGGIGLMRGAPGCGLLDLADTKQEQIRAWELGTKNRLFGDDLQLDLTGFAYVWSNMLVTTLVQTSFITQNADSALAAGFELEAVATPLSRLDWADFTIDSLLLTFNLGLTYSEFTDFDNGCLVEDPDTCISTSPDYDPQDWTGNQLPRSPLYTFTVTAQYEQSLGRYGSLTPFVRYFYSDQLYFRAANQPRDLQPAYGLMDVTLSWRNSARNLSVEGFVNNVTDEVAVSQKLLSSYLIGSPTLSAYQPPRTWGVRLGLQW